VVGADAPTQAAAQAVSVLVQKLTNYAFGLRVLPVLIHLPEVVRAELCHGQGTVSRSDGGTIMPNSGRWLAGLNDYYLTLVD
jgi:hypothetical protein